jgi:DNA-binding protein Fis
LGKGGVRVSGPTLSPDRVLVASSSECLPRRLESVLEGYCLDRVSGAEGLLRHPRQRPYLLCFLDAREFPDPQGLVECLRARPGERYVLVLNPWQRSGYPKLSGGMEMFGFLREPFAGEEVRAWARRAADEARLLQGDRSLDELLYGRFRFFLQNLGPGSMTSLHDLVWERVERPLITAVLEWTGGNQSRAAEILGIHRNTLRAKIRSLRIDPSQFCEGRA